MKLSIQITATLLGLAFITFGLNHFFHFIPMGDPPPKGSPPALFFGAIGPTGFLTYVKVVEILGGIAVMIPLLRNLGLILLGPVVVNILAFQVFIGGGSGLFSLPVIAISVLSAFVLWGQHKDFTKFLISTPEKQTN